MASSAVGWRDTMVFPSLGPRASGVCFTVPLPGSLLLLCNLLTYRSQYEKSIILAEQTSHSMTLGSGQGLAPSGHHTVDRHPPKLPTSHRPHSDALRVTAMGSRSAWPAASRSACWVRRSSRTLR